MINFKFGLMALFLGISIIHNPGEIYVQSDCVYGKDVGRDFFVQVVAKLKDVAPNNFAIDALIAWKPYENTKACWNPLATTWKMEVVSDFNSAGVQNYQSQDMGARATANTLNLKNYDAIRKMFRLEAFDREGMRSALGTWGTCKGSRCDSLLNTWQTIWLRYSGGPSGYVQCAIEHEQCSFSGTKDVAYGANGLFYYKYGVVGGIACNNDVFGDPASSATKACYVRDTGMGPIGFVYCAIEHEQCSFSGTKDIAYGANGFFSFKYRVVGGIACNNDIFGDPISGATKSCFAQDSTVGPQGYTFCAGEHEQCSFSGTQDVAYGANEVFNYKYRITGGIACNNDIFGDPASGATKSCFAQDSTVGPQGYSFCAGEYEKCNFSGTQDVAYGANGIFYYRYGITGGIECSNDIFGDPVAGAIKSCFTQVAATSTMPIYLPMLSR